MGSWMLHDNGVTGEMTFSEVLITTRNPTLDQISEELDQVKKVRVKYGQLPGPNKMGFRTEDEVQSFGKAV
jgi:hypothetical protein